MVLYFPWHQWVTSQLNQQFAAMHHTLHALYPTWTLGIFFVLYSMLFIGATASLINAYRKSREQSWVYVFKNPTIQSCIYWSLMLSSAGNDHKSCFLLLQLECHSLFLFRNIALLGNICQSLLRTWSFLPCCMSLHLPFSSFYGNPLSFLITFSRLELSRSTQTNGAPVFLSSPYRRFYFAYCITITLLVSAGVACLLTDDFVFATHRKLKEVADALYFIQGGAYLALIIVVCIKWYCVDLAVWIQHQYCTQKVEKEFGRQWRKHYIV